MKKIVCVTLVLLIVLPMLLLCSCSNKDVTTLYVYNWGEYISTKANGYDSNAEFEKWYFETYGQRVKVNYSTYPSNEDMYAKITSGSKFDVIVPSDYMVERMIKEDLLRPLNKENIPNLAYLDLSRVFDGAPYYDPEEAYTVPYTYGTVGIIYDSEKVKQEDVEQGWALMWNETYKGDILQFNNSRDAFATAMFKLNYDVNTTNETEWRNALEELKKQKPLIQGYVMDEIFGKMEKGSAAIAPYYAGDFLTMYEENDNLAFYYPAEGTNVFVDSMCIPKNSNNPEIAERYINFMLSKEAAIANAEAMYYASPNKLVTEDADYQQYMSDVHEDAMDILYGTSDIPMQFYKNLPQEQLNLVNELWEELKVEGSAQNPIVIVAIVVAVLLVGVAAFFIVRRARRKKRMMNL